MLWIVGHDFSTWWTWKVTLFQRKHSTHFLKARPSWFHESSTNPLTQHGKTDRFTEFWSDDKLETKVLIMLVLDKNSFTLGCSNPHCCLLWFCRTCVKRGSNFTSTVAGRSPIWVLQWDSGRFWLRTERWEGAVHSNLYLYQYQQDKKACSSISIQYTVISDSISRCFFVIILLSLRACKFLPTNQVTISSMSLAGCTSACVICVCDVTDGTVKGVGETGATTAGVTGRLGGEKVRVLGCMGYLGQGCQCLTWKPPIKLFAVSKDLAGRGGPVLVHPKSPQRDHFSTKWLVQYFGTPVSLWTIMNIEQLSKWHVWEKQEMGLFLRADQTSPNQSISRYKWSFT